MALSSFLSSRRWHLEVCEHSGYLYLRKTVEFLRLLQYVLRISCPFSIHIFCVVILCIVHVTHVSAGIYYAAVLSRTTIPVVDMLD